MKQKILFILLVIGITAVVSAQGQDRNQRAMPAPEDVTVSGALVVAHGMPAIKSGDVTYIVTGLNRLAGFVDGLREGAQVTIEGKAVTNRGDNTLKLLRASKMTLSGRSYDLSPPGSMRSFWQGWLPPHSQMRSHPMRNHGPHFFFHRGQGPGGSMPHERQAPGRPGPGKHGPGGSMPRPKDL